jgi:hypothetical protein
VYGASEHGHTETVALLLANKADINAATKVQKFIKFKYLLLIDKKLQGYLIGLYTCYQRF